MQGNYLPDARPSPRLENGALYWYAGDTFELELDLSELEDQDGNPVTLDDPELTVTFYNERRQTVKTFTGTTLAFDDTAAAQFPKGRYTWDVELDLDGEHKTLLRDALAVVE